MHTNLNIPLNASNTRRKSWRVVWMFVICLFSFLVLWSVYRVITLSSVARVTYPSTTEYAIEFPRTGKNMTFLLQQLGSQALLPQHPWTLEQLLTHSKGDVVLYYDSTDLIGVSVGRIGNETLENELSDRLSVYRSKKRTLVTLNDLATEEGGQRLGARGVLPGYAGLFIQFADHLEVSRMSHRHGALFLKHRSDFIATNLFPEGSTPIMAFSPLQVVGLDTFTEQLDTQAQLNAFFDQISEESLISEYTLNNSYITEVRFSSDLDLESLGSLGRQVFGLLSITSTSASLPDGSLYQELSIGETRDVTVETTDEYYGTTFASEELIVSLRLERASGETLLRIERKNSESPRLPSTFSKCPVKTNELFLYPSVATLRLDSSTDIGSFSAFPLLFEQIRVHKHGIRLCY